MFCNTNNSFCFGGLVPSGLVFRPYHLLYALTVEFIWSVLVWILEAMPSMGESLQTIARAAGTYHGPETEHYSEGA